MSTERKPPFEWTDEDRAKLVPGSVVECDGVKVTCAVAPRRGIRIKWAFGIEARYTQYADLSRADPATIEPPKPTLAEALREEISALRELADETYEPNSRKELARTVIDRLEAILKEHGHG